MSRTTRIIPAYREGEKEHLDRHWRTLFLDTLAETSNVAEASRRAGINPSRAYKVRRMEAAFRASWAEALAEGYAHLEMETLHRLRAGTVTDAEGRKFDMANAMRLLSLHRQSVTQVRDEDVLDDEGTWVFATPRNGMQVLDLSTGALKRYLDGWQEADLIPSPAGGSVIDAEARDAIGGILAALTTAGILPSA